MTRWHTTRVKRWYLLALLATIFLGLGIVLPIALYASGDRQWVLIIITAVTFGGCGLLMAWFVPPTRREEIQGLDDLAAVSPGAPPEPGRPTPWTLAQVAAELARTLEPTPYVVEASATRVRVRADLADARFLAGATIRDVKRVFVTDIVPKGGGKAALLDSQQEAEWAVGPSGDRVLALRASARIQGGKSWTWSRRTEYGVGHGRVVRPPGGLLLLQQRDPRPDHGRARAGRLEADLARGGQGGGRDGGDRGLVDRPGAARVPDQGPQLTPRGQDRPFGLRRRRRSRRTV